MPSDPIVHVYVARTPDDQRVLAIAPDDLDPAEEKLYWHSLSPDQDPNDLLGSLGYRPVSIKNYPGFWNHVGEKKYRLRFGKTSVQEGIPLIGAIEGAAIAGLIPEGTPKAKMSSKANTFRVYGRRGHGPKPYSLWKRPLWVEPEVKWWMANRTGQGRRTDKTAPVITAES